MKTVIIIRHAAPLSEGYAEDALRSLSSEGISTQHLLAKQLQERGYLPDAIFSSPLVRAIQSAEILADAFGITVEEEEALGDAFDAKKLIRLLQNSSAKTIYLVGHAPTLALFIDQLVGETVLPQGLSKSHAAIVTFADLIDFGIGAFTEVITP